MKRWKIVELLLVIILFVACANPSGSGGPGDPGTKPISNRYTRIDDKIVFYSEFKKGDWIHKNSSVIINGIGSIKVNVSKVSGISDIWYGIDFNDPDEWGQQFSFDIKTSGFYKIGWVDSPAGWENDYEKTEASSAAIIPGLNKENELRIDYNTTTKTYLFYINDTLVFTKTFSYIVKGLLYYYCEVESDASATTPYRYEFNTTSPFTIP